MFKNYIKVAIRNLLRNKTYVFINVLGLSVAIAVCIVTYLNFTHVLDANKDHVNYERIFKINGTRDLNGDIQGVGITPLPLVSYINENVRGVESAVRFHTESEVIKVDEDVFRERIAYVDNAFFNVFTFPLKEGISAEISNPNNIVLSTQLAERLFDESAAVGNEIRLVSNGREFLFTVSAVMSTIPTNSSFRFDAAISFDNYFDHYTAVSKTDWNQWVDGSFVFVTNPEEVNEVEDQLQNYIDLQRDANENLPFKMYRLDRVDRWARSDERLLHGRFWKGMAPSALWGLNSSALLILLLSCFNFTNTSISFSNRRLKEIGIRKVFGGVRTQLVAQFLIENLILIITSLVIGLVLAEMLIPAFNNLFWFLRLELDLLNNFKLMAFLAVLLLLVALFSAVYPSVYVSSFKPVNIFRGKTKFGSGNKFLRFLIAGQFVITVYNIFGSIVFYQNSQYQTSMDQGYDMHKSIVVPINGEADFDKLNNSLKQFPDIALTAGSNTQLAFNTSFAPISHQNQDLEVGWLKVGFDYLEVMGIEVLEGRPFREDQDSYSSKNILLNEELVENLGWQYDGDVLGRRLYLDSAYFTVIGVVKDFHEKVIMRGGDIRPAIITLSAPTDYKFLTVRVAGENLAETNDIIESSWMKLFPYSPYDGYYQSKAIEVVEDTNRIINHVNIFVAAISILLSGIGLYTLCRLISLNALKRSAFEKYSALQF